MASVIKLVGLRLALAAMLVRALLPTGWMPDPTASVPALLTICTLNGPVHMELGPDGKLHEPAPAHNSGRQHDTCPYAAASHFATTPPILASWQPSLIEGPIRVQFRALALNGSRLYEPQSPRAPPRFV